MQPETPSVPASITPPLSARARLALGLRDFAHAVRHIHDLNTFLEVFALGLEKTGVCGPADFRLPPPDTDARSAAGFAPGRLSMPIGAGTNPMLVAHVSPPVEKQHFGPEDLHVLAALSELLGSALGVAQQLEGAGRAMAALKAVLSFAPVGICTFDTTGRVEAINRLAGGWLALNEGDNVATGLPAGVTLAELRHGASFHLRVGGRLLFCESRAQGDGPYTALVVTDLTPEQGRLLDSLHREVYRANHLRRPLHFLLLEKAQPMGALLSAMPAMRATIGSTAIVGPYDAGRIGVIFPDATWSAAIAQLRRLTTLLPAGETKVGRSELRTFTESPEEMIQRALEAGETLSRIVRPRVLVHDEYRGVAEALQLVLADDCEVIGSTDLGEASRLLQEQHFDVILADVTPVGGGEHLVARARARNQGVKAFLLSGSLPSGRSGQVASGGEVPVFSKPFNVEHLRDRVLESLSAREEAQK